MASDERFSTFENSAAPAIPSLRVTDTLGNPVEIRLAWDERFLTFHSKAMLALRAMDSLGNSLGIRLGWDEHCSIFQSKAALVTPSRRARDTVGNPLGIH